MLLCAQLYLIQGVRTLTDISCRLITKSLKGFENFNKASINQISMENLLIVQKTIKNLSLRVKWRAFEKEDFCSLNKKPMKIVLYHKAGCHFEHKKWFYCNYCYPYQFSIIISLWNVLIFVVVINNFCINVS